MVPASPPGVLPRLPGRRPLHDHNHTGMTTHVPSHGCKEVLTA
ncbi:Hypothetical protein PFREUD_08700 [Propionibacterium freudenreichii subsp. shermanii CIRM-BIA1]|uniref:Uncharacterized protein n=1 Tax=Propionibacterium freudenreichii subsp. shermanii (strain ATCC 9614 / DSM 4902 / CIP 103027 / NCIMB 8099 / CIRM-BIA1) TaxID=754252 RepID=D7GCY5_PROFC|nr:Hypothetical protein PFREUD_08700 [Propionibacterium freudenreichii subsp. shermanii CIRM-BIA1]